MSLFSIRDVKWQVDIFVRRQNTSICTQEVWARISVLVEIKICRPFTSLDNWTLDMLIPKNPGWACSLTKYLSTVCTSGRLDFISEKSWNVTSPFDWFCETMFVSITSWDSERWGFQLPFARIVCKLFPLKDARRSGMKLMILLKEPSLTTGLKRPQLPPKISKTGRCRI